METPTVETPAAPAPPATPEPATVSASLDAVSKGDFSAFRESEAAAKRGTPKPPVEAKSEPVASPSVSPPDVSGATPPQTPEARGISKRQQEINDRIREAVTRATAEKDAEIARLRGGAAPAQTPETMPTPREPEWKRFAQMPDAPKLAEFETIEDHAAAMALFIADTRHAERTQHEQARTFRTQVEAAQHAQVSAFDARVTELAQADPEIVSKIVPIAQDLGARGGPYSIISNLALRSEVGPQVLLHFGAHPEVLTKLATLPESLRGLPVQMAVREHLQIIVKEFGKLEAQLDPAEKPAPSAAPAASPISAAPPPLPTISRAGQSVDPKAVALAKGDFAAFSQLERSERAAKRRSA